ncbi:MAG: nitrile hydratase accessory protein [Gammaproteobacteria bacterium]
MGSNSRALKPLASTDGDPVFDELWQAQALAMADSLVQGGLFAASDWSEALGQALKAADAKGDSDTQETYYACVLSALENLVDSHSAIDQKAMVEKRNDWEAAYLSTPHGKPVRLNH